MGRFNEPPFTTLADGTFSLPIESPDTNFFQATKAKFYTAMQHPKVKLSIFSGDVLFSDNNIVKVFSGALCSPEGTTTVAVITTFEYMRSETSNKVNPIKLEYMPIQTLIDTMSSLEDFDGEQMRQELTCYLIEQVSEHAKTVLNDLDDSELIVMFTAVNPKTVVKGTNNNEVQSSQGKGAKGGKGSKGSKGVKGGKTPKTWSVSIF